MEIDGHEHHKTKEQRYKDYQRERFLMNEGYIVIRFMASEVFLDPDKCVYEVGQIFLKLTMKMLDYHDKVMKK